MEQLTTTESKTNLIKAIISVMKTVKNIEKNMNIGDGSNSYKGVSDKDVKQKIGEAMAENGLALLPIFIEPTIKIDRWVDQYQKPKQSVFTEVKSTYLLIHESGESIEIQGYGHGVDSQDKSAGKATTYALKNALLYSFLVPTGSLEDTDNTHSDKIETPPTSNFKQPASQQAASQQGAGAEKPWLNLLNSEGEPNEKVYNRLTALFAEGKSIDDIKVKVRISKKEQEYIETNILGYKN
jgi:hypothetical protein